MSTFTLFKKKKEPRTLELAQGVYVSCPEPAEKQNEFLICMPKGIIVFLIVIGSMCGFTTSINVRIDEWIFVLVMALGSLFFSGLYVLKKPWMRDVGYIGFFIVYVFLIFQLKDYVNSGFAAIINTVRHLGETYLGLDTTADFEEKIANRSLAMLLCMIFIGLFVVILLNIFVSNYMSIFWPMIIAIPLQIIPQIFRQEGEVIYTICLAAGFMGIWIFKNSRHFLYDKEKHKYYVFKKNGLKVGKSKKVNPRFNYSQNDRVYHGVAMIILFSVIVLTALSFVITAPMVKGVIGINSYKERMEKRLAEYFSYGRGGYSDTGMSGGFLYSAGGLKPRHETALHLTMAPYTRKPIYLKAYTGLIYTPEKWLGGSDLVQNLTEYDTLYWIEMMQIQAKNMKKKFEKSKNPVADKLAKARMDIKLNGSEEEEYSFVPYFTYFSKDDLLGPLPSLERNFDEGYEDLPDKEYNKKFKTELARQNYWTDEKGKSKTRKFTYYPNLTNEIKLPKEMMSKYYYNVRNSEHLIAALDETIRDAGLRKTDPNVIEKLDKYFEDNFTYSYNAGDPPTGWDFTEYFLTQNKRGVCTHFATATTLILRRLGIPCRFVSGYVVTYPDVLRGKNRPDLKYEDYYQGYSELQQSIVKDVNVEYANAHAWVEVYQEGKGWIVVDTTPPNLEASESSVDSGFWRGLQSIWGGTSGVSLDGISGGIFVVGNTLKYVVFAILFGWIVRAAWKHFKPKYIRWRGWHTGDTKIDLVRYYQVRCEKNEKYIRGLDNVSTPVESIRLMASVKKDISEDELSAFIRDFEKACYSGAQLSGSEAKRMRKKLDKFTKTTLFYVIKSFMRTT
ncbi:transglutaminase-like domain-containing protein [Eubacterium xylanophilum]|uniref:transglutaminase-like domain-containing protein n=1 Tax=Eubacterium xylanophilum TaxID=39497 RepID=UPI00047A12E3|nr:transglutaminase-like domain-containing protein [Eubacterium xylanophilum]